MVERRPIIGIFGSAIREKEATLGVAAQLGEVLADNDVVLITGAASGVPYAVAYAAYKKGLREIWGFSPAKTRHEQEKLNPHDDHTIYSRIDYVPTDYPFEDVSVRRKHRNVLSTATCDAGIIVAGRFGTLNEFTNLYDMGKVIGVLVGTGGVADIIEELMKRISKETKAVVIFEKDPQKLVELMLAEVQKRKTNIHEYR